MDGFHRLDIRQIRRETADAVVIEFDVPPDQRAAFTFVQGQYLTLRAWLDGQEVRRCYSICSGAQDGTLRVAVKAVPGGRFGTYANCMLRAGDSLEALPPAGRFTTALEAAAPRAYAAVAAGSGITPILSHIRTILAVEGRSRFTLAYVNKTSASAMFAGELAALVEQHPGRLRILSYFTQESVEGARAGRPDIDRFFAGDVASPALHAVFVCGPLELVEACRRAALANGLEKTRFHSELFFAAPEPAASEKPCGPLGEVEVSVLLDGRTTELRIAADGPSLLEAALDAGLEVPHSCCMGVCDTCRVHVREGRVEMRTNYALSDEEVAEGYALACQSRPASTEPIVLDFDRCAR